MKHVPSIIALVLIVAACNLSNRFKTSNNSNSSSSPSSSSDKSVTGGEPVEKPNPTAAQTEAIANGQEVKWDQQGITWTVPANWKKQDVRNETLSYAGGGAFLSANISTMDSSFPTDVSIKAMSEGAKTEKKNGKYDEVKWLALDDLLGLEFRQSKQERPDDIRSEEHTSELQSHSDLVCRRPMPTLFPYTTLFRSRRCVSQRQHLHDGFEFSHRR